MIANASRAFAGAAGRRRAMVTLIQAGTPSPSSSAPIASSSASRVMVSIARTSGPASASTRKRR